MELIETVTSVVVWGVIGDKQTLSLQTLLCFLAFISVETIGRNQKGSGRLGEILIVTDFVELRVGDILSTELFLMLGELFKLLLTIF